MLIPTHTLDIHSLPKSNELSRSISLLEIQIECVAYSKSSDLSSLKIYMSKSPIVFVCLCLRLFVGFVDFKFNFLLGLLILNLRFCWVC